MNNFCIQYLRMYPRKKRRSTYIVWQLKKKNSVAAARQAYSAYYFAEAFLVSVSASGFLRRVHSFASHSFSIYIPQARGWLSRNIAGQRARVSLVFSLNGVYFGCI